jgi:hypothetical protein
MSWAALLGATIYFLRQIAFERTRLCHGRLAVGLRFRDNSSSALDAIARRVFARE